MTNISSVGGAQTRALHHRASAVIPGGVYGHVSAELLWPGAPQFWASGDGSRVRDVDGRDYIDLMCSWGPIVLGHRHPGVEDAVQRQHARIDCGNGPGEVMVELAERMVGVIDHADWCMFAKNGSDATTLCLTQAREATGKSTILVASGAYHGALPWCNPIEAGVVPGDRAHLAYYRYNDLESVYRAADAHRGDLAGIIVSPFKHDAGFDQELPDPTFARGLRELCDRTGALLILDDVRCGLRLAYGSSWEPLGVRPDLSAWGKAIANGYALAAVVGGDHVRGAAKSVFATGSYWFSSDAMAASLATLEILEETSGLATMKARGRQLWDGIQAQAAERSLDVNLTGPVTMPYLTFADDERHERGEIFCAAAAEAGLFVHPRHNWFLSAGHTEHDMAEALAATAHAFDRVAEWQSA